MTDAMTPADIAAMPRELRDAGSEGRTLKDAWETCEKSAELIEDLIAELAKARATIAAQAAEIKFERENGNDWMRACNLSIQEKMVAEAECVALEQSLDAQAAEIERLTAELVYIGSVYVGNNQQIGYLVRKARAALEGTPK